MKAHVFVYSFVASCAFLLFSRTDAGCQDLAYGKSVVNTLSSSYMHGRGYIRHGDKRASNFIRNEYQKIGLLTLKGEYFQPFTIDVNTFPGAMKLAINGKLLVAGHDFMIDPASGDCNGRFGCCRITAQNIILGQFDTILRNCSGKVLVIYADSIPQPVELNRTRIVYFINKLLADDRYGIQAVIEFTSEKLSFGISEAVYNKPFFRVNAALSPGQITETEIQVRHKYRNRYMTRNIVGSVNGSACPDSFIFITAHYDHLGLMGKETFFPGANDNASGIALLLNLAEYFSKHPPRFTIVFLALSGEEPGLLGSQYFTDNPLVELSRIKFLINLDLVGSGEEGIVVVNGSIFPQYFNMLLKINDKEKLLPFIKKRGEACNSDHCPFYRKGVPSFFIYTTGGSKAYHDLNDRPENLTYKGFEGMIVLLTEFIQQI